MPSREKNSAVRANTDFSIETAYRQMLRIRKTEEKIIELYASDVVKSPVHLSIGQEFVSVGVCEALGQDDTAFGTYRSHALYLAKGGNLRKMWAELYGKEDGCARGKGGSMHLCAPEAGMVGTSAIVASSLPNAVGYAMAEKMRGSNNIVAVFFGDGATDEGVFHESINFAALKKLPILFVCENNLFAIYSHVSSRMANVGFAERAGAYGVPYLNVDDGRAESVFEGTREAVERIRNGDGPQFMECLTCRWRDHVGPGEDLYLGYRSEQELNSWIEKDDLPRTGREIGEAQRKAIDAEVERELADALQFAEASNFPQTTEAYHYVYA